MLQMAAAVQPHWAPVTFMAAVFGLPIGLLLLRDFLRGRKKPRTEWQESLDVEHGPVLPANPDGNASKSGCWIYILLFYVALIVTALLLPKGHPAKTSVNWAEVSLVGLGAAGAMLLLSCVLAWPTKRLLPVFRWFWKQAAGPMFVFLVLLLAGLCLARPVMGLIAILGVIAGWFGGLYLSAYLFINRGVVDAGRRGFEIGDIDGAIADLRAEMEAGEPDGQQHAMLGMLLARKQHWADAFEEFQAAEALVGRQEGLLLNQAVTLQNMGHLDEALELLVKANEEDPDDLSVVLNLSFILAELGRFSEATPVNMRSCRFQFLMP